MSSSPSWQCAPSSGNVCEHLPRARTTPLNGGCHAGSARWPAADKLSGHAPSRVEASDLLAHEGTSFISRRSRAANGLRASSSWQRIFVAIEGKGSVGLGADEGIWRPWYP